MTDHIDPGPQAAALCAFIDERKFQEDLPFYPGAIDEPSRLRLQAGIDDLATRLLPLADRPLDKAAVLDEFRQTMGEIDRGESEDVERCAGYMEALMDIFGIESSDGLLNDWVYGFDPNELKRQDQH